MRLHRKQLSYACLFAAGALLVGGYIQMNFWQVLPALLIVMFFWQIIKRSGSHWLPSGLLVSYTSAAAGGVLLGISPAIMIAGTALALVSWELAGQLEVEPYPVMPTTVGSSERAHLTLLVASVGVGTLLAEGGLFVHITIPFGVVILTGLLVLFSLYQLYRLFGKQG